MTQYKGIAFPFRKSSSSFPAIATDDALIRDSIMQIMATQKQERVMRPDFGANVFRFVFANNDDFLVDLISTETRTALTRFEPRIIIQDVQIQQSDNQIISTISYVIRSTGQTQTLDVTTASPR